MTQTGYGVIGVFWLGTYMALMDQGWLWWVTSVGAVPAALTGWYEEGAEPETETLTTDEDAGSTEREDQEFVREWQLHAERQRQRQQGVGRQERLV